MNNNFKNDLLSLICCEINRFTKRKSVVKVISDRRSTFCETRSSAKKSLSEDPLMKQRYSEFALNNFTNPKNKLPVQTQLRHSVDISLPLDKNRYIYSCRKCESFTKQTKTTISICSKTS